MTTARTHAGYLNDNAAPSLNLTPQRGPSVWDDLHRKPSMNAAHLAVMTGGALLLASSMRQRKVPGLWTAAFGVGLIAGAALCPRPMCWPSLLRFAQPKDHYDAVDQALADSFPASDPAPAGQFD